MNAVVNDGAAVAATVDEQQIRRALDEIKDPCSVATSVPMGLDEMGLVASVVASRDGHVQITLRLSSPVCEMVGYMRTEAIARVSAVPGVRSVSVGYDSGLDWTPDLIAPAAQARRRARLDRIRSLHTSAS